MSIRSDTNDSARIRAGRSVGLLSEQELLDWLMVQPRTLGWDALVLYDRFQANRLLLQEYIDRYAREESYIDPITSAIEIVAGAHWEYLSHAVLDAPRLSFENSTIGDSKARLTLRVLSGAHFTVAQNPNEPKRVTMINNYDSLQGVKLVARISLGDTDGSVTEDGRVMIDLAKGVDFRMVFGTTARLQSELGEFFALLFSELDDDQKVFVLNEITQFEDGELFKPELFRMRVMPSPGASERDSGHYGDGAVMVFVASQGHDPGGLPDKDSDWVYPIPEGRSSTVIISDRFMLQYLVAQGIKDSPYSHPEGATKVQYVSVDNGRSTYINVVEGEYRGVQTQLDDPAFEGYRTSVHTFLRMDSEYSVAHFKVMARDCELVYSWAGENLEISDTGVYQSVEIDKVLMVAFRSEWKCERFYRLELIDDRAVLVPSRETQWSLDPRIRSVPEGFHGTKEDLERIVPPVIIENANIFLDGIINVTGEIDAFRLHGILFRSADVMQPVTVSIPRDVAIFGDLAPDRTRFAIEPVESVVQAGKTLKLSLSPSLGSVEWRVESIKGFEGGVGSISQDGTYTAPTASSFPGNDTLVRVAATAGIHTSSALVRIVVNSVNVNPLVAVAPGPGSALKMSAGALDRATLTWTIKSETGATLTDVPPDGGAEFEDEDRFYVPGSTPTTEAFTVDEVTVTDADGNSATSSVLVAHNMLVGRVQVVDEPGLPDNQLKLIMTTGGGALPGVEWKVLAGGGTINQDGIFTLDPTSHYQYAVVTGLVQDPIYGVFTNYLILPVPLVDLDAAKRALL